MLSFRALSGMGVSNPVPRRIVRFGVFEVDSKAGEVRKHGRRLRLQEKPFHVLEALLEHPGEVVLREELRARLWPADTFVDFDNGLNNAVNKVRAALGDSASVPKYVETVGRRGYRFIAAVDEDTAGSAARRRCACGRFGLGPHPSCAGGVVDRGAAARQSLPRHRTGVFL